MKESPSEHVFDLSGGALCLDFANTVGDRPRARNDHLTGYGALVAWGRQTEVLSADEARRLGRAAVSHPRRAATAFRRAIDLRECLYRIFSTLAAGGAPADRDLTFLNRQLAQAMPRLQIARRGDALQWNWSGPRDALDRMLWPVLRSTADLLVSERRINVRECDSENCSWLFVDRSRGARRRWCDMKSCGNRAKARRFYRRKKAAIRLKPTVAHTVRPAPFSSSA